VKILDVINSHLCKIVEVKKDLEKFYEDDSCSDSVCDWLDKTIDTIENLVLEISYEAKVNHRERHSNNSDSNLSFNFNANSSDNESSER